MHRYDRGPLVVRLGEEEPCLHPIPVSAERGEVTLEVGGQRLAAIGLGRSQLRHLGQPAGARLELPPGADLLPQLIGPPQDHLGGRWVVPQAGVAGLRGQLRELEFLGGQVKGAPPYRPRGEPVGSPRP
jgi:hypothetical protein